MKKHLKFYTMEANFNVRKFINFKSRSSIAELSKPTFHIQEIHPSVNLDALHRMSSGDAECAGSSCGGNSCGGNSCGGNSCGGGDSGGSNFKKALNAASNN